MPRYSHAYTLAFELENDNEDGDATKEELFFAVLRRLANIMEDGGGEMLEACLPPYDTHDIEEG
jgi:hypothetical protein